MEPGSTPLSLPDRRAIVATAVVQSLLLLLLHEGIAAGTGWLMEPVWRVPAYALAIGAPLAVMLSIGTLPMRRIALIGVGFAFVLILTGLYTGHQGDGGEHARWSGSAAYILLATLGGFVALPLAQVLAERGPPRLPYERLYFRAWNNGLLLNLTLVFVFLFWLILTLWAALFELIEVGFFSELFRERRFIYPVTGLVGGLGLTLVSGLERVVAANRRVLIAITKGLAPLLAFVTVLFLLFLTVLGVETLWDSGVAAALLLFLTTAQIVFVGATYDDGRSVPPYPAPLRMFVQLALVLTPLYPLLAMWAIGLRVDQYGWSVDRVYAMTVAVVLLLYSAGYAVSVYRRSRERWLPWLARCNTAMACVVVVTCVALAGPVLDARRISVADQVDRLLEGDVDSADFDYEYLRFDGGRPGRVALERLAALQDHPQAGTIRRAARKTRQLSNRWAGGPTEFEDEQDLDDWIDAPQPGADVPEPLWALLRDRANDYPESRCFRDVNRRCLLFTVDLNADGQREYVLLHPECGSAPGVVYERRSNGDWSRTGQLAQDAGCGPDRMTPEAMRARIASGELTTEPAPWQRLRIGEETFSVLE